MSEKIHCDSCDRVITVEDTHLRLIITIEGPTIEAEENESFVDYCEKCVKKDPTLDILWKAYLGFTSADFEES